MPQVFQRYLPRPGFFPFPSPIISSGSTFSLAHLCSSPFYVNYVSATNVPSPSLSLCSLSACLHSGQGRADWLRSNYSVLPWHPQVTVIIRHHFRLCTITAVSVTFIRLWHPLKLVLYPQSRCPQTGCAIQWSEDPFNILMSRLFYRIIKSETISWTLAMSMF